MQPHVICIVHYVEPQFNAINSLVFMCMLLGHQICEIRVWL